MLDLKVLYLNPFSNVQIFPFSVLLICLGNAASTADSYDSVTNLLRFNADLKLPKAKPSFNNLNFN